MVQVAQEARPIPLGLSDLPTRVVRAILVRLEAPERGKESPPDELRQSKARAGRQGYRRQEACACPAPLGATHPVHPMCTRVSRYRGFHPRARIQLRRARDARPSRRAWLPVASLAARPGWLRALRRSQSASGAAQHRDWIASRRRWCASSCDAQERGRRPCRSRRRRSSSLGTPRSSGGA